MSERARRGGVYVRMSKSKGETKIEAQEAMCRRLAEARGVDVVRVYVDDGISAFVFADRPGWAQMLADVQAGELDVLLAQSEDRFTRQPMEKETLAVSCAGAGVTWLTVNDGSVDPATADGEFFSTLRAGLARMESRRKAERQRQSNDEHAAKGLPVRGGMRPFGYCEDKATPHPQEAPLIAQAYRDLISGARTLSAIRTAWNAQGVRTVNGKPWDLPKVEKVIRRARNAGYVQHRGGVLRGADGAPVFGQWEPITDEETYAAALAILNNPRRRLSKVLPPKHLCSSIAKCGACGTSMRVAGTDRGAVSYRCGVHDGAGHKEPGVRHVSIPCAQLDEVVRRAVIAAVLFAPRDAVPDADTATLAALHTQLHEVRQARANLLELVKVKAFTAAEVAADSAAYLREAEDIEEQMSAISQRNARAALLADVQASLLGPGRTSIEDTVKAKQHIGERFDALSLEQRRALVRGMLDVTVQRGRGEGRVKVWHKVATSLNESEEVA